MRLRLLLGLAAAGALLLVAASLASASHARGRGSSPIEVVAAESIWGSIAAQLGGEHAHVTSIITSPAADPHDYEPTALDARTFAGAKVAVVNGVGYDAWASRLLSANPVGGRVTLDVGDLVGVKLGGNPHRWYSPVDVARVAAAITATYTKLDPADAGAFARLLRTFETRRLARYHRLIASIAGDYAGTPVGTSESVFAPLASALRLRLLTPTSFLRAVSEGADPTAADRRTIDAQIARRQIKVWVLNPQNSTPDVARITDAARAKHIQITTVTETPTPAGASFEDWQVNQLEALEAALRAATAR
jgi:zinc/manganese transport system substrate-binding protein